MAKFSKIIVAAAASLALGAAQADVVIDLFNGTQGPVNSGTIDNTGTMQYAAEYGPDNTVQGLWRDIGVQRTGGNLGNAGTSLSVQPDLNNGDGILAWSVASGATARAIVRWDGVKGTPGNETPTAAGTNTGGTVTPTGATQTGIGAGTSGQLLSTGIGNNLGLGLDFNDQFQFDVLVSDLGFTFWLELYDVNGNFSKLKFESQSHLNSTSTPIPVAAFIGLCAGGSFEFGDANDTGVPGVDAGNNDVIGGVCSETNGAFDIGHLGAIQFIMESGAGAGTVDLQISAVQVVPEPGALALVGLGLLGAAGAGARRRRTV